MNKKEIIEKLKREMFFDSKFYDQYRDDEEIAENAIKVDISNFEYISDRLKHEKRLILKMNPIPLELVPEDLKDDKEIVLESIKRNELTFAYASERLRSAKEVVLEAVNIDARCLKYAGQECRDDKEIVLNTISKYPLLIKFASDKLKDDEDIVLMAIDKDLMALSYASKRIRNICGNENQVLNLSSWIKYKNLNCAIDLGKKENSNKVKV